MRTAARFRQIERKLKRPMLEWKYYSCIADGKKYEWQLLDIAMARLHGHTVEQGPVCRVEYTLAATDAEFEKKQKELREYMENYKPMTADEEKQWIKNACPICGGEE